MQFDVDPSNVSDAAPTDSELRAVVGNLCNDLAAGATGMKAEHLKMWLADMKREESEDGVEGIGDRWQSFASLLQAVWKSGTVPTQMTWMIIVLLPKRRGDYRNIGLIDPIWKVVEKVMVAQLSVIKLHDCLHGRPPGRGIGTAIMKVELQQQLAWGDQKPLYQIYLNWGGASKSWQSTVSGQICFASRRNSGTMQRWCVAWVVIMVSLLRLIVE